MREVVKVKHRTEYSYVAKSKLCLIKVNKVVNKEHNFIFNFSEIIIFIDNLLKLIIYYCGLNKITLGRVIRVLSRTNKKHHNTTQHITSDITTTQTLQL